MLKRNEVVKRTVTMSVIAAVPLIFAISTAGPSSALPAADAVRSVDLGAEVTQAVTSALDTAKQPINLQDGRKMLGDAFAGAHDRLTQGCSLMGAFLDQTQTQLTDAFGNAERQFGAVQPGPAQNH